MELIINRLSSSLERLVFPAEESPSNAASFQRVTEVQREPEQPQKGARQIMKELKELNQMEFDEDQIRVEMEDENPFKLIVTLTPNDGLYKDGQYEMVVALTENYPTQKPSFSCRSQIFHPNVDYHGKICFSLLDEDNTHLRIADYVHGLLWLLYYPNLYSRLNMDCPRDEKQFARMVRTSIVGGDVEGRSYDRSAKLVKIEEAKKRQGERRGS